MSIVARKVTDKQNQFLPRPFEALEVKEAIFSMHPDKEPRPDEINPAFFQAVRYHRFAVEIKAYLLVEA